MRLNIIIYLLFLLNIFSCNLQTKNKEQFYTRIDQQKDFLRGREVQSIEKILNDSIKTKARIVFLYNGLDCETCILRGYKLAKSIDSIAQKYVVYIVSTSANIGADQIRYDYSHYVYNDERELVRNELKYIYTPVFLLINPERMIEDVFYPNISSNNEEKIFVMNCIKMCSIQN